MVCIPVTYACVCCLLCSTVFAAGGEASLGQHCLVWLTGCMFGVHALASRLLCMNDLTVWYVIHWQRCMLSPPYLHVQAHTLASLLQLQSAGDNARAVWEGVDNVCMLLGCTVCKMLE